MVKNVGLIVRLHCWKLNYDFSITILATLMVNHDKEITVETRIRRMSRTAKSKFIVKRKIYLLLNLSVDTHAHIYMHTPTFIHIYFILLEVSAWLFKFFSRHVHN